MSTDIRHYVNQHPGLEQSGGVTHREHVDQAEGHFARLASNYIAALEGKATLMTLNGLTPYSTSPARYTATLTNTGTFAYGANGLVYTSNASPSDGDNGTLSSLETRVIAANKIYTAVARLQVSSAANLGFQFGFATAGTTDLSAGAADAVYLSKSKSSTSVLGKVIANSASSVDSASLLTAADATEYRLGVCFKAGSSAAESWGYFSVGTSSNTPVITAMSTAAVAKVYDILATTPATLGAFLGFKVNGTTQRTGTISYALAQVDR